MKTIQFSLDSAISSLKAIIAIVTGLALTNAVEIFFTNDGRNLLSPTSFTFVEIVIFLLTVTNILRFQHGNWRHLDDRYFGGASEEGIVLSVDFLSMFATCILFAAMSYAIKDPKKFVIMFFTILIFDILWVLSSFAIRGTRSIHLRKWLLLNFGCCMALVLIFVLSENSIWLEWPQWVVYGCLIIIAGNTIGDYILSWDFYFPTLRAVEKHNNIEQPSDGRDY